MTDDDRENVVPMPSRPQSFGAAMRVAKDYRARQTATCAAENKQRGRKRIASDIAVMRAEVRKAHALTDRECGVVMAAGFDPGGDDAWCANAGEETDATGMLPSLGDTVPDAEMRRTLDDVTAGVKQDTLAALADPHLTAVPKAVAWLTLANALGIPVTFADRVRVQVDLSFETRTLSREEKDVPARTPLQTATTPIGPDAGSMTPALRAVKLVAGCSDTASSKLAMMAGLLVEAMQGRAPTAVEYEAIEHILSTAGGGSA